MAGKKKEESVEENKAETTSSEKTEEKTAKAGKAKVADKGKKAVKEEKPKKKTEAKASKPKTKAADKTTSDDIKEAKRNKRAEKIGVVWSDKMMKTVVVRVERLVKHQMYHKYMKKRKKFMAHDELGAGIGDRVRIVETRPLSARKRWRVVEIIQKAQR